MGCRANRETDKLIDDVENNAVIATMDRNNWSVY